MTKFTYVELFAGIGGVSFGFDKNGGTCVMASDIDKYASQTFKALHPGVDLRGDVTKIDANDVPDHDVLSFTSPCQSFSTAGKRKGFEDTRGTLTFEALRIAKVKRPKALFMENVKGLVNHDKGNTLDTIIHAMNEIGYTVDFSVLNSKHFGVPQSRERVFIIALRDDLITPAPWINTEGSTMLPKARRRMADQGIRTFNFDWPTQTEVTTRLRDMLETEVSGNYYLSDEKTSKLLAKLEENPNSDNIPLEGIGRLAGLRNREDRVFAYQGDAKRSTAQENIYLRGNAIADSVTVGHMPKYIDGLPIREATKQGYAIAHEGDAVNFQFPDSKTRRGRVGKQIANTLEASNINQGVVTPKYRIRKLTPLECWRLQGFTDAQHQTVVDAGLSDSQRYKQAGNAVTVNVITAIGERLLPYLS